MADPLRTRLTQAMKAAMIARDAPRTSTVRMVLAKVKDADIAGRPGGADQASEEQVIGLLRGMVKSRRESMDLYTRGNRPELAAKEAAEIAVIDEFLPQQMGAEATAQAVAAAVAEAGATGVKEMGKVMAVLRARHAASLDLAKAGPLVKAALGG